MAPSPRALVEAPRAAASGSPQKRSPVPRPMLQSVFVVAMALPVEVVGALRCTATQAPMHPAQKTTSACRCSTLMVAWLMIMGRLRTTVEERALCTLMAVAMQPAPSCSMAMDRREPLASPMRRCTTLEPSAFMATRNLRLGKTQSALDPHLPMSSSQSNAFLAILAPTSFLTIPSHSTWHPWRCKTPRPRPIRRPSLPRQMDSASSRRTLRMSQMWPLSLVGLMSAPKAPFCSPLRFTSATCRSSSSCHLL